MSSTSSHVTAFASGEAGSNVTIAASVASSAAATAPSCRTCPKVNARRKVPNVDGAFTPGITLCTAPSRRMPRSSMLSAPEIIPAMIEATLAAASAPAPPAMLNLWVTSCSSPARRARCITGTNPAELIRLGSSKLAVTGLIWQSCISRMAFLSVFLAT